LSIEELEALVAAPDPARTWGRRDRALFATFYSTGMRVAEALSRDRRELPLVRLCQSEVLELPIVGKGRKPRLVFLDRLAQELLHSYLTTRTDALTPLFRSYRGAAAPDRRLSARQVQHAIKQYALRAGLATVPTPHTRIVQAFLGHASLATTQRYTAVRDPFLRRAYAAAHHPLHRPPR
jgi:integrase/recombinase XerD